MCIHFASCQADSVTEGGVDFIWQLHQSQKLLVFQKLLLREPTPAAASYRRLPERHHPRQKCLFLAASAQGEGLCHADIAAAPNASKSQPRSLPGIDLALEI